MKLLLFYIYVIISFLFLLIFNYYLRNNLIMKFKCVYLNLSFINIKMLLILHLFDYHLIVVNILHIYLFCVSVWVCVWGSECACECSIYVPWTHFHSNSNVTWRWRWTQCYQSDVTGNSRNLKVVLDDLVPSGFIIPWWICLSYIFVRKWVLRRTKRT